MPTETKYRSRQIADENKGFRQEGYILMGFIYPDVCSYCPILGRS